MYQVLENSDENIGNVGGFIETKSTNSSIFSRRFLYAYQVFLG